MRHADEGWPRLGHRGADAGGLRGQLLTFDTGIPPLLATPEERERLLCVLNR